MIAESIICSLASQSLVGRGGVGRVQGWDKLTRSLFSVLGKSMPEVIFLLDLNYTTRTLGDKF
jgi:hypothetical protein